MRVLLHDNSYRPLGDPAALFALSGVVRKVDNFVKQQFGSWAGLNGWLLGLIGKHPATDPKKIAETKAYVLSQNWTGVVLYNKLNTLTPAEMITLLNWLQSNIMRAKQGADKGDWVANRFLIVYTEMLQKATDRAEIMAIQGGANTGGGNTLSPSPTSQNEKTLLNIGLGFGALKLLGFL